VTKETNVHVKINLDGTGVADCSTGIHLLDHMLDVSTVCLLFVSVIMVLIISAQTKYALW
jgi:imidazoleglycerol phosphate dehydratase HisB